MHAPKRPVRTIMAIALIATTIAVIGPNQRTRAAEKAATDTITQERLIDLNTADEKSLSTLPGIGEAIARRIVEFREEHGPFERVEDLLKIKGVGEKSFEKLRSKVSVSKPS